ncbi:MAG: YqcC family protein [Vibrio sp.]
MSNNFGELTILLQELQFELERSGLWQSTPPHSAALQSTQPFAVDTLAPHEWLQWVFLPRMHDALAQKQVPSGFAIAPYFSQVWQHNYEYRSVLRLLGLIDEVCR